MYELIQAGRQTYYIDCPSKIGIYVCFGNDVYLIDSGNDKETAKKVLKIVAAQNWNVRGILNTHSHADHIGGNRFIQEKVGCPVFSPGVEGAFTRYPFLEPAFLYGGYPCKELRNKFLMANESVATPLSSPDFPGEVEIIPLPGHSFDMVGFRTPDRTVFLADSVNSPQILSKYGVPFIYDVARYLETLDSISALQADIFVPSHAEVSADIRDLVRINREQVFKIESMLLTICRTPKTTDEVIAEVFAAFGLSMNVNQYVLVGSTLRSFLSWMKDRGVVNFCAKEPLYLPCWTSVGKSEDK